VKVLDTTAAGNSFNGDFAFVLALSLEECTKYANAAASLPTIGKGAQGVMTVLQGGAFIAERKCS